MEPATLTALAFSIAHIALHLADCILTADALQRGGRELNPFMRWMLERPRLAPWAWPIKMMVALAITGFVWCAGDGWGRAFVLGFLTLLILAVCVNGVLVLRRLKARGR